MVASMTKLTFAFATAMALLSFGCKKKGGGDANAMAKMTEYKEKMCACKDADCAKKVSDDMSKWGEQFKGDKAPKMSEADQKKATEIGMAMAECMTKVMVPGAAAGSAAPAGDMAGSAGSAAPAGDTGAAPVAATPEVEAICKRLEALAMKEGGEAVKQWEEGLKTDCTKEISEQKAKKGDKVVAEFKTCLDGVESLTKAMATCKQID